MEMSKDFEQLCPEVRISLNQQGADYTVALNHIEHGLSRDNQIQVANKDAALISKTKEGGSIKGGVKKGVRLDTCRLGQEIIGISACHNVTLPQVQSPSPGVVPRHSQPPAGTVLGYYPTRGCRMASTVTSACGALSIRH